MAYSPAAALYNLALKPNPYRQNAEMMGGVVNNMPNDQYGYGALAKIPLMMYMGQQMGQAQNLDEQHQQEAQQYIKDQNDQQFAQTHIGSLFKLSKHDPQAANEYKDELVKTGNPHLQFLGKVNFTAPTDKNNYMHLDLGDKQLVLHPTALQNQQLMQLIGKPDLTPEEIQQVNSSGVAALYPKAEKPTAGQGTAEGRRIYGELQNTSGIPDTMMQDPNSGVMRSAKDIYTGAMKQNLAEESPALLKDYNAEQNRENKESDITSQITTDSSGKPVYATKSGKPSKVKAYIKPDKPTSRYEAIKTDPNTGKSFGLVKGSNQWEEVPAPPGTSFAKGDKKKARIGGGSATPAPTTTAGPSIPPAGAVPLNKTIGGKPAYKLPDGRIWTP